MPSLNGEGACRRFHQGEDPSRGLLRALRKSVMTALVTSGLVSKRTSLPESLAWPGAGSGQSSSLQTQLAQHRLAQKRHLLAHSGQHRHHQLHRHILQQQVGS